MIKYRLRKADAWEGGLGAFIESYPRETKRGFWGLACIGHGFICRLIRRPSSLFSNGDETAITWLHIISGLAGCATFAVAIFNHERLERAGRSINVLWAAAMVSAFGSMFYATEVIESAAASLMLGALLPGLSTPLLALGWGVLFCTLDAREAAGSHRRDRSCLRACSMA